MDQLICASLSHIHYWYEVGMLKVPAELDMFVSLPGRFDSHHPPRCIGIDIYGMLLLYSIIFKTRATTVLNSLQYLSTWQRYDCAST